MCRNDLSHERSWVTTTRQGRTTTGAIGLCLLAAWSSGCASSHGQLVEFLRSHEVSVSAGHYTVMPPDEVTLHAPTAPEVDGVTQTVRADGKIVLRLLDEVDVAGLTTQALAGKLEALLSRYYIDPEVAVEVTAYRSQHYYIFGQVASPGAKPFTGRDTLLKALARAQPTFLAWRSQVRVVRPSPDKQARKTIVVDLDKMVRTGDVRQNVLLQEGDIIEVPPTPLAWIGLRVRELLYPLEPAVRAYNLPARTIDSTEDYREGWGPTKSDEDDGPFGY
ncbi:MAG: polysaccharide export protein [Planctomycetes bacterium]|nr:polysaccharide export protein [Planctomycetota bacterium]